MCCTSGRTATWACWSLKPETGAVFLPGAADAAPFQYKKDPEMRGAFPDLLIPWNQAFRSGSPPSFTAMKTPRARAATAATQIQMPKPS